MSGNDKTTIYSDHYLYPGDFSIWNSRESEPPSAANALNLYQKMHSKATLLAAITSLTATAQVRLLVHLLLNDTSGTCATNFSGK